MRHVDRDDSDFERCMAEMIKQYQGKKIQTSTEDTQNLFDLEENRMDVSKLTPSNIFVSIEEAKDLVVGLTGDSVVSNMLDGTDPIGFPIWKEATSSPMGVDLLTFATFVTAEMRMRRLEAFIAQTFPENIFRERQDMKARYELDCVGRKISSIFASIEQHKDDLHLEDYCVSQTSLEQVFNMHAAEAEGLKLHKAELATIDNY